MSVLLALAAGYLIGARTGGKDLDQLGRSLKALYGTDEFADVVTAARAQIGTTLHELAALIEGEHRLPEEGGDLVARVRHIVGRD
jgi:hypothetical protein